MNDDFKQILGLVPAPDALSVDWGRVMGSALRPHFEKMAQTLQNPAWHGEGDVWMHTKMVCECLIGLKAWQAATRWEQQALFIAALLHDIGKPACTRLENGALVSPRHTGVGERLARTLLWRDFGLSGTSEAQRLRETVCALIKLHAKPFRFLDVDDPERQAIRIAATGTLVPGFTNALLAALVEADIRGRVAADTTERLQHVRYFQAVSEEAGCLHQPLAFPSPFSRYAYLSGRNILPGQELYDDTWGTVILMAGLPGTGKDTYIHKVYPDLPMVSLDALRTELKMLPNQPQDAIVAAAREQARTHLRQRQPFVWNATGITPMIRSKPIELFIQYGAKVKIVYLETELKELLARNRDRRHTVPERVIDDMLSRLSPPDLSEAHEVEWILT